MIELPRAALRAGDIAETAEFFSFGTNDLTQTTFGISRDDSARFLGEYTAKGILTIDPFVSLDIEGVGELVQIAAERGRSDAAGDQARHLRRAWRRSGLDPLLRGGRSRLCFLLAFPGADRPARGRPGEPRKPWLNYAIRPLILLVNPGAFSGPISGRLWVAGMVNLC